MNSAIFLALIATLSIAAEGIDPQAIVRSMELAYSKVENYRMEVEVTKPAEEASRKEERFTYTFKKPNHVRIDFHKPHKGTIVVYPAREGKVFVRPWGWRFLQFHLGPDNILLADPSGQRVDQTDLGLLIRNIAVCMTDGRRGLLEISEEEHSLVVKVLAQDLFLKGENTHYTFVIDKKSWLPREIRESTSGGSFKRRVVFRDLEINPGVSDSFFRLNGE
jgi:outer membrane lipoprotein-sorting protein